MEIESYCGLIRSRDSDHLTVDYISPHDTLHAFKLMQAGLMYLRLDTNDSNMDCTSSWQFPLQIDDTLGYEIKRGKHLQIRRSEEIRLEMELRFREETEKLEESEIEYNEPDCNYRLESTTHLEDPVEDERERLIAMLSDLAAALRSVPKEPRYSYNLATKNNRRNGHEH
jgi:hypothetical protein